MQCTTTREPAHTVDTGCLMIGIADEDQPHAIASQVDRASDGLLTRLDEAGDLPRKPGKALLIHLPPGLSARRLLLVGMGKDASRDPQAFSKSIRAAGTILRRSRADSAHCLLDQFVVRQRDSAWVTRHTALTLAHTDYIYRATKSAAEDAPPDTESVSFLAAECSERELRLAAAVAAGVRRCRELGDAPPNLCTPLHLAEVARELAEGHDRLDVEVLDEQRMGELNMNALLAVAQGSANPARLIRLSWRGAQPEEAPLALVGKGVTFDTGGISIKPRDRMEQMKFDMCGAASVIGVIEAAARLNLPLNIDGVVAAVENMPDGKAYRPGDIITAMNGKTIEVHNTDAEGRMILADAIYWTGQTRKPRAMVDIATLTGACVVALGHHASAVMTQDDELAGELLTAGESSTDRAWRLPLWDDYQEQIETPFADMKNIGGMPAGSITAGCFLSRFAEGQRWAHIDIAGSAWRWGKPESATGRPVGMLIEWLVGHAGGWDGLTT